ncbi:MAG: insulinase family protein [Candidatus Hydrogenedentota bacterium]|nr:MAG: insulinase family protein [Candidatus Hydrogenedentota bacterium]
MPTNMQATVITEKEVFSLENGLTVLLENLPGRKSATAGLYNPVGSRFESEDRMGYSHFVEHMLFKGTERRTYSDISREIDRLGGYMNASTSREITSYYISISSRHLPVALDVLEDIFFHSTFPDKEFEVEKKVILEEIKMGEDSPDDFLFDCFYKDAFGDNPLGRPIAGTLDSIGQSSRNQLLDHYHDFYGSENTVLSIAGFLYETEAQKQNLISQIKKQFENQKSPSKSGFSTLDDSYTVASDKRKYHNKDLEQAHFAYGLPGLPFDLHHEDRAALQVFTHLMGGSMSSRLFRKLREERGLCYSVGTFHTSYALEGIWGVYCGTSPARLEEAVKVMLDEMEKARSGEISDEEIEESKNGIIGIKELQHESSMKRASYNAQSWLYKGQLISLEEELSAIEKVTPEEVKTIASKLWKGHTGTLTYIGSKELGNTFT